MAKATWCTVTPTSGRGNGTINISSGAHAGRGSRNTIVTVQTASGTRPSKTISVTQAGVGAILTMAATHPDVPGAGGVVTINGTSNSPSLVLTSMLFGLEGITGNLRVNSTSPIPIEAPDKAQANITIPGDPGASAVYNFVITLNVPQNPLTTRQPMSVGVAGGGKSVLCNIFLLPGASTLALSKSSLSLVNAGTAQAVNITSNDDWAVS